MTFYNRVILIGSLAESPDTRYTPSGSQVTKLSLQITPGRGSKEGSIHDQRADVSQKAAGFWSRAKSKRAAGKR